MTNLIINETPPDQDPAPFHSNSPGKDASLWHEVREMTEDLVMVTRYVVGEAGKRGMKKTDNYHFLIKIFQFTVLCRASHLLIKCQFGIRFMRRPRLRPTVL